MNIIDFGLGIRFEAGLRDVCLNELMQTLCAEDVAGLDFYAGEIQDLRYGTENVFLCVFTKGKLKCMKRIFQVLSEDAGIATLLCGNMPFIQTHALEGMSGLDYLGEISEDGTLAQLQGAAFVKEPAKRKKVSEVPNIMAFVADCEAGLTARETIKVIKSFAREKLDNARVDVIYTTPSASKAMDSFFEFGRGMARVLKVDEERTLRLGLLNGKTAFIQTEETVEDVQLLITRAKNEGLKQILIDARFGLQQELVTGPKIIILNNEEIFADMQCKYGKIEERLTQASAVYILGAEETAKFWMKLCLKKNIQPLYFGCIASANELQMMMNKN